MTKPEQQHTGFSRIAEPGRSDATGADSVASSTLPVKSAVDGEKLRVGDLCWVLPEHHYTKDVWGLVDYEPVEVIEVSAKYVHVRPIIIHTAWSETGYAFLSGSKYLKRIPIDG